MAWRTLRTLDNRMKFSKNIVDHIVVLRIMQDVRGLAAVELALLLPILVLFLAGVIDFSRLASQRMQVRAAAQAGADYALRKGWNESAVASAITVSTKLKVEAQPSPRLMKACLSGSEIVETSTDSCPTGEKPGSYVLGSARAAFTPLMPWPGVVLPSSIEGSAFARVQ